MKNKKELSIEEIRTKLHKFEWELRKYKGKNKLVEKYLTKVEYMLMWLRLIRINKNTLDGWRMPDINDVIQMKKLGKERDKLVGGEDEK